MKFVPKQLMHLALVTSNPTRQNVRRGDVGKRQVQTGLMQQIFIHLNNCELYALFGSGSEILQKLIKRSQSIIRLTQGIDWNRRF